LLQFGASWLEILQLNQKKAVEQEFSWSGLTISLSIAFFIVFVGATILHLTYVSIIY